MKKHDLSYYRMRLVAEQEAARVAPNPLVARRHLELAEEYLSLLEASGETAEEEKAH